MSIGTWIMLIFYGVVLGGGSIALIAEPRLSLLRLLSRAHRLTEHRRILGMDRILTARPYICRHAKSDSARR